MALGDPYITRDELKTYLKQGSETGARIAPGINNSDLDPLLDDAIASASREIDNWCKRQFNKTTTASSRIYTATSHNMCLVDDFHTVTGLVIKIDEDYDGVYETTLSTSDYTLEPVNGVVNGQTGWPYCRVAIREYAAYCFPTGRHGVQVTAQWGWNAVPDNIKQAAKLIGHDTFKARDNPFGVAGFSEFGVIRVRNNVLVESKLRPYRRGGM